MSNKPKTGTKMGNHTPGPWLIRSVDYGENIEPSIAWIGFGSAHPKDEHKANARLIVSAPEMLAALYEAQSTLDFIEASDSFVESRDAARDSLHAIRGAIAKATGKVDHE